MQNILEKITSELELASREKNVRILYACESGSRAWGFASPDSDYDVRFIYAHPAQWYLSIFQKRDVIEKPITDELDLGGWDIRKSLFLLAGSNAPLIEWLHSPVVYMQEDEFLNTMRALARKCFRARNVCHHYYSMAEKLWRQIDPGTGIRLKTLLYVLRALLCVDWIIREASIPPVVMSEMLQKYYSDTEFLASVTYLTELKSGLAEKELLSWSRHEAYLEPVRSKMLELFSNMPEAFPLNNNSVEEDEITDALREFIRIEGE